MAELRVKKKNRHPVLWTILALVVIGLIVWLVVDTGDRAGTDTEAEIVSPLGEGTDIDERENWAGEPGTWGDDSGTTQNPEVQEFVSFVNSSNSISMDHETVHEGLTKLAAALSAVNQGQSIQGDVDQLKQEADQLMEDRLSQQHANIARNAFINAANIIQEQEQQHAYIKENQQGMYDDQNQMERQNQMNDQSQMNQDQTTRQDQTNRQDQMRQNNSATSAQGSAEDVMEAAKEIDARQPLTDQKEKVKEFFDEAATALQQMSHSGSMQNQDTNMNMNNSSNNQMR